MASSIVQDILAAFRVWARNWRIVLAITVFGILGVGWIFLLALFPKVTFPITIVFGILVMAWAYGNDVNNGRA